VHTKYLWYLHKKVVFNVWKSVNRSQSELRLAKEIPNHIKQILLGRKLNYKIIAIQVATQLLENNNKENLWTAGLLPWNNRAQYVHTHNQ